MNLENTDLHSTSAAEPGDSTESAKAPPKSEPAQETTSSSQTLPILPVRGIVLFPGMAVPVTIGRPSGLKLIDAELPENKMLGILFQKDEQQQQPGPSDLFQIGVSAQVLKMVRQADGTVVLIVQILERIQAEFFVQIDPYLRATVRTLRTIVPEGDDTELNASLNNLRESAVKLLDLSPEVPEGAKTALANVEEPERLTDMLAGNLGIDTASKQKILEELDLVRRMHMVQEALQRQIEIAELQQKLRKDVEGTFSDSQR